MKKENLKDVIDKFINERLDLFKKEREVKENDFTEEIGEINEFKNLSDVEKEEMLNEMKSVMDERTEGIEYDFSEEEVHKIELDLRELEAEEEDIERLVKDIADDIKTIDEYIQIPCKINNESRLLVDSVNCNIKPIPLLNIALISNLNIRIIDIELNDYMLSVLDVILLITMTNEQGQTIILKTDVDTLYRLGLVTAVDSLLTEIELSPVEFRGITTLSNMEDVNQVLKFSKSIE